MVGIIAQNEECVLKAMQTLTREFGPPSLQSETIDFDFTGYYENEMGLGLIRCWVGFDRPVEPSRLAELKLITNEMERRLAGTRGKRQVNIDPGILTLYNLVLASTKNHAHRVCLSRNIYAELTLIYRSGAYKPLEWTYPDYRSDTCIRFLCRCRELLLAQDA